jgi:L-lactate dehydrogenase
MRAALPLADTSIGNFGAGLIMKIGIIGAGKVGSAFALAAVVRGSARTILIVDRTRDRAKAVATDLRYGAPLCPKTTVVDGDYDDLADSELVMITAGINEKAGGATDRSDPQGRLRLLHTNAGIYRDIVPHIVRAAPRAVILAVTDPPDPLADVARISARHDRVLSTGTFLDSLRFRVHLAQHFEIDANQVEAQVIGEHGVSQVFLWSSARIAGVPIGALVEQRGETFDGLRKQIEDSVRYAISRSSKAMTPASLALASWRHGSQNWCFAMSERSCRSEVTIWTLASRCRFLA